MRFVGLLALLGLVVPVACDGGAQATSSTPGRDGGAQSDGGSGVPRGRTTTSAVAGAVRAKSPNYELYGSIESGDRSGASSTYRRQNRVTGATEAP